MNLGLRFYLFAISTALSGLVTHCVRFAISWLAVEKTGSATIAAAIFSAPSFAQAYTTPLLAPIADYFDRLTVYRICLGLDAVSILALLLTVAEFSFSAWLVGFLLVLLSLISALRNPTAAGLTPSIVALERMTDAQSIRSAITTTIGVLAPALAGLLIAWHGVSAALQFATWAAAIACVAALGIKLLSNAPKPKIGSRPNYFATWHLQIFDGIRAVFKTRVELLNATAMTFLNGGLYPFFAIGLALWVNTELHYGAWAMSVIEIAFWVGMFLSGTVLLKPLNQQLGRYMVTTLSCFTFGGSLILASQCKDIVSISFCLIMGGVAFTAFNVNTGALRSAAAPPEFRSRMFAGVSFLATSFNPFSTLAMGAVISTSTPSTGVAVCGTLMVLSGIVILKNRDARSLYMKPLNEIGAAYSSLYPDAFRETLNK